VQMLRQGPSYLASLVSHPGIEFALHLHRIDLQRRPLTCSRATRTNGTGPSKSAIRASHWQMPCPDLLVPRVVLGKLRITR
jgi:hypothetical protein